jgi:RNA polymerase sigma-70 factor (ECF subfamily)
MATQLMSPEATRSINSFDEFFREHFGKVYGLLYRVTGNAHDAEDLSQELFLKLSQRQPPPWESEVTAGWLWKAATHTALNALRGDRRRTAREERAHHQDLPLKVLSERDEDPERALVRNEQREAIRAALRQLGERDSMLLLVRHSGLTYAETAAALNLNPSSIGTLLARAEERFKQAYVSQESQDE